MVRTVILAALALAGSAIADTQSTCNPSSKCPESTPCCSQYGECGVGAYCLGGCDPLSSFSLDACMPAPVCQDRTMDMKDTSNIVDVSKYLGDPSTADWVAQGTPLSYNGNVLLTMPANSSGTVLASTVYMWYGNVTVNMKTSKDAGVISAFIFLGDVKDEIDFEWVGTELDIAQTNFFWQGNTIENSAGNITGLSNVNENFHEYTVEWTPDAINWYVDGNLGMTRKKSDTWNATTNSYSFPQTPVRVQLSVWPGGASSNAPGTIAWAGGPIDWNSQAIQQDGYYYSTLGEITMTCYQTNSPPGTNSGRSYTYKDTLGLNTSVVDGNDNTVLSSLLGSGLDPTKNYPSSSASQSTQAVIPGLSGGGSGTNGEPGGNPDSGSGSGSGSSSGGSSSGSGSGTSCNNGGFSQNCGSSSGSNSEGFRQEHALGASAFAALIAVAAMLL
ncbi:carbohydrate-binding module family 18 [Xylariaceae sp. FL0255]|nr:carbohydrate-binding module family 18 [Xylariaceae sp. FL0255]